MPTGTGTFGSTTEICGSFRRWSATVDKEGYREYKIVFLVKCSSADDGPANALLTSGLPTFGSVWDFYDDFDAWAFRQHDVTVTPIRSRDTDVIMHFELEYLYSTKPFRDCADVVEDPLLKPQIVGGGLTHLKEEGVDDRFGKPILNSSLERIHSVNNEWDKSLPSIEIEQNVAVLDLDLCEGMLDTVNAYTIWGLPKRCIKLSSFVWEKKYYGVCYPYYTRKFQFDINFQSFDRDLLDEGTKVLNGKWNFTTREWELVDIDGDPPNRLDPTHFIRFKDPNAENTRTLLDNGVPYKPLAKITTCTECPGPGGTFAKWRVHSLQKSYTLTYDSICTWSDSTDPQNPTLSYVALDDTWSFELDDAGADLPGGVWVANGSTWNCLGANTMVKVPLSGDNPTLYITLSEQIPSKIRIEKYDESDFLLLGIPTSF